VGVSIFWCQILSDVTSTTLTSMKHSGECAEETHRQALELNEPVLGKEHPDTLMSASNLMNVLSDQVRYGQAEEIHPFSTSTPVYRILHHTLIKHREMMISIS